MAQRTCTGGQDASLRGEISWLRRRRELEDMPMARINARSDEEEAQDCAASTLARLVAEQNRLLCDILGAVNALTATQLAAAQRKA